MLDHSVLQKEIPQVEEEKDGCECHHHWGSASRGAFTFRSPLAVLI